MTDRRHIKQNIKKLGYVKTWQLLILLILVSFVGATFLRLNNNAMVERRTAVLQADKVGDVTSVKNNLYSLQRHAAAHMNASTGPVYLEQSYRRDSQKAFEAAQAATARDSDVLRLADETCKQRYTGWSQAYVVCVATEQAKYPVTNTATQFTPPNPELYRHEFNSPLWSPDFAGFSVFVFGLLALLIVIRIVMLTILKLLLKKHYSSI